MLEKDKNVVYTEDLKMLVNKKVMIKKTITSIIIILIVTTITMLIIFAVLYVKNN